MDPEEKVMLVTGASSGIGRACARAGAEVVLAARSSAALAAEAVRIAATGGSAFAVELDVTSDDSVAAAVADVLARFGRIDAALNVAGNGGGLRCSGPSASRAPCCRRCWRRAAARS